MELYKRLLQFVKPYWFRLSGAMICMVFVSAFTAGVAFLIKPALDELFFKKDLIAPVLFPLAINEISMLHLIPLAIILLYFMKGAFDYGQSYLMSYVGQRIVADIRNKLYCKIQTLSLSFFTKNPTGVLMSRVTNILKDSFSIVGLIGVVFYRDWKLASFAFLVFPFAIIPIVKFGRRLRGFSTLNQNIMGTLTTLLHETISGNRIVKAFGMEEYENKRFSAENNRLFRAYMKAHQIRSISSPVMELIGGLGSALIIWYGGYSVIKGYSTPGNFFSFLAGLIMLYEPIKRLSGVNNIVQQGLAAASRVFEILDTEPEIRDKKGAKPLAPVSNEIEFKGVSFKYDDELVLKNINIKVKAGEAVAFVGMSGGGKTTLVNLIPRFYDVSEGAILIDDVDIRDVTIVSLRSQIAIVTQQTILFNDTVMNNIAYGDIERSEDDILMAAKAANAHDFIMETPLGYDTMIGEQGVKLSGGQRQRISIARAILKDAPILILDEATSSLDSESEIEVQNALENLMKNRTTFIIAHRLSTIRNADRIIVIVGGEVVEEGIHEDLLKRNGEYTKLYELQFRDNGEVVK
ncbi:MAG: ATP-binding cassette subfamily B bacterial MsbA [bacterium]|nr:MAG: ATP-binding cassette subfamily B bacterial MsbA [bacterium]